MRSESPITCDQAVRISDSAPGSRPRHSPSVRGDVVGVPIAGPGRSPLAEARQSEAIRQSFIAFYDDGTTCHYRFEVHLFNNGTPVGNAILPDTSTSATHPGGQE